MAKKGKRRSIPALFPTGDSKGIRTGMSWKSKAFANAAMAKRARTAPMAVLVGIVGVAGYIWNQFIEDMDAIQQ